MSQERQNSLQIVGGAEMRLRIGGVLARISGMSPRIRADLSALLRPFVLSDAEALSSDLPVPAEGEIALRQRPDSPEWQIWLNDEQVFASGAHDRLLRRLEWLVVAQSLQRARQWIVWHAASLARDGRAVVLVGDSGMGKSTLAVGLALRGWRPLADDLTLLDPQTRTLAPFRRCFHVSSAVGERAARAGLLTWPTPALPDYARPHHWGAVGASPTWLVVVRRDTSQPTQLTPLTRAQAAGALFAATIRNPAADSAAAVAAGVAGAALGCWELNNSDLETTLDLLTATLLDASTSLAPVSG